MTELVWIVGAAAVAVIAAVHQVLRRAECRAAERHAAVMAALGRIESRQRQTGAQA